MFNYIMQWRIAQGPYIKINEYKTFKSLCNKVKVLKACLIMLYDYKIYILKSTFITEQSTLALIFRSIY